MPNRILNLIFRADTGQAVSAMRDLGDTQDQILIDFTQNAEAAREELARLQGEAGGEGIEGLSTSFKDFRDVVLGSAVFHFLKKSVEETMGAWSDYAQKVMDLSSALQMNLGDASALQEMMDRFSISQYAMVAAFEAMGKQGLDPTLASLKHVLQTYTDMEDGAGKLEYAQKMLGERGVEDLIPMWEQLTEAQRNNLEVTNAHLEITKKDAEQRQQLAEVEEGWATIKLRTGQFLTSLLWEQLYLGELFTDVMNENAAAANTAATADEMLAQKLLKVDEAADAVAAAYGEMSLAELKAAALEAMHAGNWELLNYLIDLAKQTRDSAAAWDEYWAAMTGAPSAGGPGKGGAPGGGDTRPSGYGTYKGYSVYPWTTAADFEYIDENPKRATGGTFTVGGSGGIDSTQVSFMATPGETVSIGGGTNDNQEILAEIRRLVRSIPVAMRDAMERV